MLLFHYYAVYPAETHEDKNILVCKVVRGQNHKEVSIKKPTKNKTTTTTTKTSKKKKCAQNSEPKTFQKIFQNWECKGQKETSWEIQECLVAKIPQPFPKPLSLIQSQLSARVEVWWLHLLPGIKWEMNWNSWNLQLPIVRTFLICSFVTHKAELWRPRLSMSSKQVLAISCWQSMVIDVRVLRNAESGIDWPLLLMIWHLNL